MMFRRFRLLPVLLVAGLFTGLLVGPAAHADTPQIGHLSGHPAILDWEAPRSAEQQNALTVQPATGTPIQDFKHTINDGGLNLTYSMIGKNPYVAQTHAGTTVKVFLQPVVIHFSNGLTWDPTVSDTCDSGASAVSRTAASPVFVNKNWSFGGTQVATQSQYVDAFQRAQFWQQANPSGINPSYHVRLALTTLPKITVNVPNTYAATGGLGCGSGFYGGIEINYWDYLVQASLLPNMAAQGLTLKDFPMFMLGNIVMYQNTTTNCCILGYHSAKGSGSTFQSYGTSMYDNTGIFLGTHDVSVLTHEISEWIADPAGTNPTKPWGHIGQVGGCQNNLETGDPLSGTVHTKVINNFTYHVQELAFYSWFYHQNPSQGVNGWFSNYGKFTNDADPCS